MLQDIKEESRREEANHDENGPRVGAEGSAPDLE